MSEDNLEIVRGAFAVLTIPGDPEPMIAAAAPAFEMHLVGVSGEPVRYVGVGGIREFSATSRKAGNPSDSRPRVSGTWATASWCWVKCGAAAE